MGLPERAVVAVGRRGACARTGPAVGAQGAGRLPGGVMAVCLRAGPDLG